MNFHTHKIFLVLFLFLRFGITVGMIIFLRAQLNKFFFFFLRGVNREQIHVPLSLGSKRVEPASISDNRLHFATDPQLALYKIPDANQMQPFLMCLMLELSFPITVKGFQA